MKELTIEAAVENIEVVTDFVTAELEQLDCPIKAQTQIAIAIDELFGKYRQIRLFIPISARRRYDLRLKKIRLSVIITFIDNGKPFNPLEHAEPTYHTIAAGANQGRTWDFPCKENHEYG